MQNMDIRVLTNGRNGLYCAYGIFDGKKLKVLQGSRISNSVRAKVNPIVEELRKNPKLVSQDYVVLEDIMFRSASTAASFVTGNISNGMRVWKLESGKTLGSAIKQNEASSESNPRKRHGFLQTKLFGIKRNTMTEKKDGVHKATIKFRKNTIRACTSRKSNSGIKCTW